MATEVIEVIETAVEVVEVLTQGPQGPQGSAASVVYGTTAGTATEGNDSRIPTQALNPANAPTFTGLTINGANDGTRSVNASGKMFFGSVSGNTGMLSEAQNSFVYNAYVLTGLNTSVTFYRPLVICSSNTPQLSIHPNNRVGIGVAIPQSQLDVSGDITATSTISIKNGTGNGASASIFWYYNAEDQEDIYVDLYATRAGTVGNAIVLTLDGTTFIQTIVDTWNTNNPNNTIAPIQIYGTAVLSAQTVTFSGGTDPLKSTIDVVNLSANRTHSLPDANGTLALASQATDYEVTDATKGVIMKSPNGNRWRLTIDNSGSLIRTIITLMFLLSFMCGSQAQVRDLVYTTNNIVVGPTNTNALSFTNSIAFSNVLSFGTNAPTVRTNLGLGASWLTNSASPATTNATNLVAGTLPDARLSTNVLTIDTNNNIVSGRTNVLRFTNEIRSSAFAIPVYSSSLLVGNLSINQGTGANLNNFEFKNYGVTSLVLGSNTASFTGSISVGDSSTTRTNLGVTVASNLPAPYSGVSSSNSLLVADGSGSSAFVSTLPSLTVGVGTNTDVTLQRETNNSLAQRNGTNPQTLFLFNTYSNSTNYERGKIAWTNNVLTIGTEKGSGGGTARALELQTDGAARMSITAGGSILHAISTGVLGWNTSTLLRPLSGDGTLGLYNNAQNDFGRLQFGGTNSNFPALKRTNTALQVRLADDSSYTTIDAQLRAQGTAPTNSTDTGTAGDIRYDATNFYVCTASNTWNTFATNRITTIVKSADQSKTNTSDMTIVGNNDPELTASVVAGTIYSIQARLQYTAPATGGLNAAIVTGTNNVFVNTGGPIGFASREDLNARVFYISSASGGAVAGISWGGSGSSTGGTNLIWAATGVFRAENSGTLTLRWAQNTTNATPTTLKAGSSFTLTKLN
jgi:hypothetical protein